MVIVECCVEECKITEEHGHSKSFAAFQARWHLNTVANYVDVDVV